MTDVLGWVSSLILVATIGKQVWKQYKDGSSEGVSKWLFVGQIAANTGFLIYSYLLKNWVFIFTNGAILLSSIAGLVIVKHHRRREQKT